MKWKRFKTNIIRFRNISFGKYQVTTSISIMINNYRDILFGLAFVIYT